MTYHHPNDIGKSEKALLCESFVTLDGHPAKISGWSEPFATVTVLPDGPSYQWNWKTALRIVRENGRFNS